MMVEFSVVLTVASALLMSSCVALYCTDRRRDGGGSAVDDVATAEQHVDLVVMSQLVQHV